VEEERRGGTFGVTAFVVPSNSYARRSPAFLEVAEHLPTDGKVWSNPLFCLWLCVQLLLSLLNCLYLNPQVFSLLPFWFCPPSHLRGVSEWLHGTELPAGGVKPQHRVVSNKW